VCPLRPALTAADALGGDVPGAPGCRGYPRTGVRGLMCSDADCRRDRAAAGGDVGNKELGCSGKRSAALDHVGC